MDNLEQLIRSQREAFDHKEPRAKLWDRIETQMDKKGDHWSWMWKAAVAVLIPVCAFLLWERSQQVPYEQAMAQLDPEFEETEMYYTQLISEKQILIDNFQTDDPAVKETFKQDLAALDSMYLELKSEFIETNNTTVIDAMIYNLQLRMDLLNQQIMILEKIDIYQNEEVPIINS
ncbi:MAG: hypothetical protein OER04_09670 [Cyclobacteriaceae bacterium]|nr:hypothetical protein [Cyclobacteriaceae bacterium]